MLLVIVRAIFVLVVAGLAVQTAHASSAVVSPALVFLVGMTSAIVVVLIDLLTPRKRVQAISAVYFGLIVGLVLSFALNLAIDPTLKWFASIAANSDPKSVAGDEVPQAIKFLIQIIICYVCVSTLLQTKDDFRFIIPYMEFSREVKGMHPLLLDTSVIIDGRIADVAETRILDQPLIIPRFVLQELQGIADSSDKLRRNRGRRGLDILNRLQKSEGIEVQIHDAEIPELASIREVDQRLVILAKHLKGKVVTNDYNLNKIARLQGVEVINLNDLANAVKPIVLPGESLMVKLIKRGEEPGQGVGYLDDGTMIVTEQAGHRLGETVRLTVTSVLQTSAGRMIFGRLDAGIAPPRPGGPERPPEGANRPNGSDRAHENLNRPNA